MQVIIADDKTDLDARAAELGVQLIKKAISEHGHANIILATGTSQIGMLEDLVKPEHDVPWDKVTAFHLDEFVGIADDHPASFRKYLLERFVAHAPGVEFVPVEADAEDMVAELTRLTDRLDQTRLDLCYCGIGENCHLAFNEPPANFESGSAFIGVQLDDVSRVQQVKEGWFSDLDAVPRTAITMTIPQMMKAEQIICVAPDERKAEAVKHAISGPVDPMYPASILQTHQNAVVYLDPQSAGLLETA
ncbi:glucosamine-6-phosphate deaminase [Pseudovibrio sp. SPO723]|uniref:glucosamine-6-phosphate deaminase n=1 Tax=Nesiotobacter zosterae TaxID=392721 RepID=UPI0029C237D0|nr:glucosamine-6-phosphate deaminase [Pseudovibrio sp. SPO723]MDX5593270.1 glucosamine-6-phosphate deaminase [Pseudovibrio sp. SPO723]